MLGADGVLRPGGEGGQRESLKASRDAGSGQLDYLGSRGAVCLCVGGWGGGVGSGEGRGDSAEVDLFILQAEQTKRTEPGLVWGGEWAQSCGWGRGTRLPGSPSRPRPDAGRCSEIVKSHHSGALFRVRFDL